MSLTKVINTGIKNAEITGSKINTSSSFSVDSLQANTLTVVNEFYSNSVNSAFNTANAAFNYANTIAGGSAIDNVARTTSNSASSYANGAYAEANLKFNSTGGLISGDVTISGNIVPTTDVTYNIGNSSNRIHTIFVGPGSIDIDGIILSNNNGQLTVSGATDFSVQGLPATSDISDKINLVFDSANSASVAANTPSQVANAASSYANGAFESANVSDQKAVTSGEYANAAYLQANTPSQVANAASSYANGAFARANTANTLAQAAYDQANTGGGGGGGSGLFNPLINVATGYGVTSTLANAVVFSANAIVHSIYLTNISNVSTSNIQVTGDFTPSGTSNVSIFYKIPLPYRSSVEMLKKPQVVKTNDILKLQSFNNDVGVSANAYAIIVYETTDSADYERVGKLVTDAYSNMYTSTSYPSVIESIKLVNQDPAYGNHSVTVVWTNSANTLQGYFTKELILPANSTIELCEAPKYMSAGDKFDAWATTTDVISIFVSTKKII